jgi:hypothetical protein
MSVIEAYAGLGYTRNGEIITNYSLAQRSEFASYAVWKN